MLETILDLNRVYNLKRAETRKKCRFRSDLMFCVLACITVIKPVGCSNDLCLSGWSWSKESETCLKAFHTVASWTGARKLCGDHDADLVKILNEDMNRLVHELVRLYDEDFFWIGLHDLDRNGHYQWLDSHTEATFIRILSSDGEATKEGQCANVNINRYRHSWSLYDCYNQEHFICERQKDAGNRTHEGPHSGDTNPEPSGSLTTSPANSKGENSCRDKLYGPNCSLPCSINCKGRSQKCDFRNGTCLDGCEPGYSRPTCNALCPTNTFGPDCTRNCSSTCTGLARKCDPRNGTCLYGCSPGYMPPRCHAECSGGTYGQNCSLTCDPKCGGCDPITGKCLDVCTEGSVQPECNTLFKKFGKSTYTLGAVLAAIVFVVFAALLCTLPFCVSYYGDDADGAELNNAPVRDTEKAGSQLAAATPPTTAPEENSSDDNDYEAETESSSYGA